VVIAKLDRLSRNAGFIFTLKDSGVDFVCADMPDANTLTIGIFATLAQHERELIGDRTRKALAAKKQQGFVLGSPQNLTPQAQQKGVEAIKAKAATNENNRRALLTIKGYLHQGKTLQHIADELNGQDFAREGSVLSAGAGSASDGETFTFLGNEWTIRVNHGKALFK
jgi:DNA invertase Pin-like site-specific DNA recombinase